MKMSKIEKKFVNSKQHARRSLKIIERLLAKIDLDNTHKILEIGCGIGIISAHLNAQYNMNVIGTDLDPEQIAMAKKFNKSSENLKFIEADAGSIPFEKNEFDLILSLNVLHHINNWDKALIEVSRVLKPNGFFILYDLAFPKLIAKIFKGIAKNYGVYTSRDIADLLIGNSFEIIYDEIPTISVFRSFSMVCMKH